MTPYGNAFAQKAWAIAVPPESKSVGVEDPAERIPIRVDVEGTIARDVFWLDRAELEHVLDSLPTARDYELKDSGEFRMRRLILEAYGRLASAFGATR
jgi:hypothetical protein